MKKEWGESKIFINNQQEVLKFQIKTLISLISKQFNHEIHKKPK